MTPSLSDSDRARFLSKVERRDPDVCWPWLASTANGYGLFYLDGKLRIATHVALLVERGVWPGKSHVCHRCDNPICVNPGHLFLGSARDNHRDKASKGRAAKKLTARDVADIRARLAGGERTATIAQDHDINPSMVSHIKSGRYWSHLEPAPVGVALHTTNIITSPSDRTAFDCVTSRTINAGGAK